MSKTKSTKKTAATPKAATTPKAKKAEKPAAKITTPETTPQENPKEKFADLCVFAFRLTEEERDAIHKAAGPAKASKFVRTLAVAAARNDEAAVKAIMKAAHATE
jgi:hypothetical protein